ncbi:hypothetical protein BGZ83_012196, partial [Gryganskiella cystojenkinii]
MHSKTILYFLAVLTTVISFTSAAKKPITPAKKITSILLVHGAIADGSSWADVIPILEDAGYNVTAVQQPLTSIPDDIAKTK